MTLNQLKYFLEVANCLNFSKAAAALYISQSALSRSIASLEEELGVTLFVRDTHSVILTATGSKLHGYVVKLRKDLDEAISDVKNTENGFSGTIKIGISMGYYYNPLLKCVIDELTRQHEKLYISPVFMREDKLTQALRDGTIDFLFSTDLGFINYIEVDRLDIEPANVGVIVKSNHRFADKGSISITDLEHEVLLFNGEETSYLAIAWQKLCEIHGFTPRINFLSDSGAQLYHFDSEEGIFLLSDNSSLFKSSSNVFIPITELTNAKYVLLYRADRLSACGQLLLHALETYIAEGAPPRRPGNC